jgi:hypothetical protein
MPYEIKQWKDIADNYGDTVLLGNGASAAVSKSASFEFGVGGFGGSRAGVSPA